MHNQEEDQIKEERSTEDNVQVINDVKETRRAEEINGKAATFLHEKDLNKNLVETLSDTDLTDEYVRLLKTLNLRDDDIDNSQDLRHAKIKIDKNDDSIDSTSGSSSSNYHALSQLSSNNMYLKNVLSKPLIQALCEIVAKKPVDPVEYLGHWLLHYKSREERAAQRKERKLELPIDMEKLKLKKVEDKESSLIERKDEEEDGED